MSGDRNNFRDFVTVGKKLRDSLFDRKFIEKQTQLSHVRFLQPTEEQLRNEIDFYERIWSPGDRMYKIAFDFYQDVEYWWIIAWFNNKPTDTHFKVGDPVFIPKDVQIALDIATRET